MLKLEKSALVVVDIQTRLCPVIAELAPLLSATKTLLSGMRILDRPIFVTEQYPKGLGPTLEELSPYLSEAKFFQKKRFSILTEDVLAALKEAGVQDLILCGMESHVCVAQSCRELMEAGFRVFLAVDAISSRKLEDKALALGALQKEGAQLRSVEALLFEAIRTADHPAFKEISRLVK